MVPGGSRPRSCSMERQMDVATRNQFWETRRAAGARKGKEMGKNAILNSTRWSTSSSGRRSSVVLSTYARARRSAPGTGIYSLAGLIAVGCPHRLFSCPAEFLDRLVRRLPTHAFIVNLFLHRIVLLQCGVSAGPQLCFESCVQMHAFFRRATRNCLRSHMSFISS